MSSIENFNTLKPIWLTNVSQSVARGETLRVNFVQLLVRVFDLIAQAIETGDPNWLNPVLDEMVEARTESEYENIEASLAQMLGQTLSVTFEMAYERLEPNDALDLVDVLLPIFVHAINYATKKEMILQVDHLSHQLEIANQTLERLDKSKSDFISIAAHELKTPLTLIEGYSSMLRELLSDESHSQSVILLKGVDNGTRRLQEIVDDMIDVSLIDTNMLSLNYQPVWLYRLFSVLEGEFRPIAEERGISLVFKNFDGCKKMSFGDSERLFQAFRNVILNSVKYTPDGGKVVIDGRVLPGFIEVIVSDTGIGIDSEDHARIFEKFGSLGSVDLHSSGKTKFKGGGPGLGLPITKGIIEAHGGAIWVESDGFDERECPGSTFHILLPLREKPPDDKTAKLFSPLTENEKDVIIESLDAK
jgi:signal transduction histidine kinase